MEERKKYLKERLNFTWNEVNSTMRAQELLMEAGVPEDIGKAIQMIPESVLGRILNELLKFMRHDMTRADLSEVLERQVCLRNRALNRYLKLMQEEFPDEI